MPVTARILGCIALLYGALALTLPFLSAAPGRTAITLFWLLAVGFTVAIAGYFCFVGKRWAAWLLLVLFLAQTVEYFSQTYTFTLIGPLPAIRFGWGWYSPPSRVNINILAIVICILSFRTARSLTIRSSGPL